MGTPAAWTVFNACVLAMLVLDLGAINRRSHEISLREAATWSLAWVVVSLGFNFWILHSHGTTPALEFLTGYLVEQSLSLDNVFIFLLVFRAFAIEARYQHRVLFWGLLGALLLRGAMIGLGAVLIARFSWILYVFVGFLLVVGVRMLVRGSHEFHPEGNRALKWARRVFTVSEGPSGHNFFVTEKGRLAVTPLFLALVVIEAADVLFAVDSVPAVFGITRDAFLAYTSNVCAVVGMRSVYFLIGAASHYIRYLDAGLSVVLIFIGGKMVAERWVHVPTYASLIVVAGVFGTTIIASMVSARRRPE
jgi:tellurite resistance protein TerC